MNGTGSQKTRKPYYRNVEDTIEDVGITPRQLGYWRKQGLFTPELGPKAKFYTKGDTAQLRFLKRLIEDLGLPVASVKKLVDSVDEESFWSNAARDMGFIDVKTGTLVLPYEAVHRLISDGIKGAPPELRGMVFVRLALMLLESMAAKSPTYDVYAAQKQALFERIENLDLIARMARDRYTDELVLRPKKEGDPVLNNDLAVQILAERSRLDKEVVWFEPDDPA